MLSKIAALSLLTLTLCCGAVFAADDPQIGTIPARAFLGPDPDPFAFRTSAECTATCSNGTVWTCSGASVSCTDGVGCDATGSDGSTATGRCPAT